MPKQVPLPPPRFDDLSVDEKIGVLACTCFAPTTVSGFSLRSVMRDAQYPSCTIVLHDPDGNQISVAY
jgi:hypothetical protein